MEVPIDGMRDDPGEHVAEPGEWLDCISLQGATTAEAKVPISEPQTYRATPGCNGSQTLDRKRAFSWAADTACQQAEIRPSDSFFNLVPVLSVFAGPHKARKCRPSRPTSAKRDWKC
jgi:hypothetical protein